MDIQKACSKIKESESKEVAALVVQDKALQRIISVWPLVRREELPNVAGDMSLADLWSTVRFDEREVVELSGLPTGSGLSCLRRAKALGLIYPDGSVHALASAVLRKAIKDALQGGGSAR